MGVQARAREGEGEKEREHESNTNVGFGRIMEHNVVLSVSPCRPWPVKVTRPLPSMPPPCLLINTPRTLALSAFPHHSAEPFHTPRTVSHSGVG